MKIKMIAFTGLLLLTFTLGAAAYQPEAENQTLAEMTITDFTDGDADGFLITDGGLVMVDGADTAVYTSPILPANIPFNAIVPNWVTNLEDDHDLGFALRTRASNGDWTEWQSITTHADWSEPDAEKSFGEMVFTPNAAELHIEFQYAITLGQQHLAENPHISQIGFTFIDSTHAPTTEELIQKQQALDAAQGIQRTDSNNPRPTVISRAVWCTHPDCNYTNDLEYIPATHLVVHHTATPNWGAGHNWSAVILAIWDYHTHSVGWGDIGYNYLVDTNGIIYEGHMNEDYENLDVVSIHAGGANSGSMGVSLIGNFTAADGGIAPSQPMLNSVVNLLAWKAEQRNINVYDAGNELPNISWGLPYLMGHRDVYGATDCPGDQLHILLPWLRNQVGTRLHLVDPYLYLQENSAEFSKSNATWQVPIYYCGHNMHAYYTWSTTNPATSTNWGEWKINVPEDGRYSIEAHIPFCNTGRSETGGAMYTINHAFGSSQVVRSQNNNVGLWMSLGEFTFSKNGNHSVRLSDLTTTDSGFGVWFDSLRLVRVDAPEATITNNTPLNETITNNPTLSFSWTTATTYPILNTTLQISPDTTFTTLTYNQSWNTAVSNTTHTLAQNGRYHWRVKATLDRGNGNTQTITSPTTSFILDTAPPTSTITGIYEIPNVGYTLLWQGSDITSGIATYKLQYRQQGAGTWTNWLTNTAVTSATFIPPNPSEVYEFRVQATDKASNQEPAHITPDAHSDQAILLSHAIMLPLVTRP